MSLKNIIVLLFVALNTTLCMAQLSRQGSEFWNKVRFGGSVGLGFTNGGFNGSISPTAIYQFDNRFAAGTSLNFNYAKFNDTKLLAYGGSVLGLYNPIPQLQFSTEFEELRINSTFSTPTITIEDNYWLPALFLGLGYTTQNVTFGLRYDVLYDDNRSIYGNALTPFVRVFF